MDTMIFDLQLFAAGTANVTLANATTQYVNTATGTATQFTETSTLAPTMKQFYDTELLENARNEHYFAQFGRKQPLPANKGRTVEWRKWNTLPNASQLVEGVVPDGQKLGMTTLTCSLNQYGMYVAVTDLLDLHAVDNVILGATEELGASAGDTQDILIRNVLEQGTNVLYADFVNTDGSTTKVERIADLDVLNCRLTPDTINQATTILKKSKAPTINGKYVAIIHPSVAYDLRSSSEWIEAHKYMNTTEIFNGEIGELHGVRFVEDTQAKITSATLKKGNSTATACYYDTIILGKDAFGIIDPAGGSMEMIVKDRSEVGGPLEQYSTAGYKFETATKILYPERMLRVLSCSAYSEKDEEN